MNQPKITMVLPANANTPVPQVALQQPAQLDPIANAGDAAAQALELMRRPLEGADLQLAYEWANSLIPADPANPPDFVNLGEEELSRLVGAQRQMLENISVKEMRRVQEISGLLYKKLEAVDLSKLSPKAQKKLFGVMESLRQIRDRIEAFFDRYKTVQGELDKLAAQIVGLRDTHIERKNQADLIGQEAKESRNVLRVAAEACKIYLEQSGRPYREDLIARVEEDAKHAQSKSMLADEKLGEELAAFKNYLTIVEGYMATTEGAIVDATQAAVALEMLEQNERIIAQGLNNLLVFTIPAWQRMIATAYIAAMGEQAAEFIQQQNNKTNDMRRKTADILGTAFSAFAKLINSNSFDDDSMEYLNNVLVEGFKVIADAAEQAEKAHDISRVKGNQMIQKVNAARVMYGQSGKRGAKRVTTFDLIPNPA